MMSGLVRALCVLALLGCSELQGRYGCGFDSDCSEGHACHPALECVADDPASWTAHVSFARRDDPFMEQLDFDTGQPVDGGLTARLHEAFPAIGSHNRCNVAPDGRWVVLPGECEGPCLAVVDVERSEGANILPRMRDGAGCPPGDHGCEVGAFVAVSSGGRVVAYTPPGEQRVYATHRHDRDQPLSHSQWSGPIRLDEGLASATSSQPGFEPVHFGRLALTPDGRAVAFACEAKRDGEPFTAICEAATDGSDVRIVLHPLDGRPAPYLDGRNLGHPRYARDGSLVFHADWGGRLGIWRWDRSTATRLSPVDEDWTDPCPLPGGRVLGVRPVGRAPEHEVRALDGSGAAIHISPINDSLPFACHL